MYTFVNREYIHTSPTHLTPFEGAHTSPPWGGAHKHTPFGVYLFLCHGITVSPTVFQGRILGYNTPSWGGGRYRPRLRLPFFRLPVGSDEPEYPWESTRIPDFHDGPLRTTHDVPRSGIGLNPNPWSPRRDRLSCRIRPEGFQPWSRDHTPWDSHESFLTENSGSPLTDWSWVRSGRWYDWTLTSCISSRVSMFVIEHTGNLTAPMIYTTEQIPNCL